MNERIDVPVLIVGAGPTGLMLANQLVRQGVQVLIIDRGSGPSKTTKALGVHARTMEIYDRLGIAGRALELGQRAEGANMWVGGERAARVPLGDIGQGLSPFPFVLILGQDDNERLLGDLLRDRGIDVHWDTELIGLEQADGEVSATVERADGSTSEIRATWIAGCDGAHSAVRNLNDIGYPGAPYEHVFFVADTRATGPMVPGELNIYLWPSGFHLFFPMRGEGHWRVVGIVPRDLRDRPQIQFRDVLPYIERELGDAAQFLSCSWFSTYKIHHRRAAQFCKGRCFLLGDAAHIHSPVGAQGMNTGLQDAYNLGWKLAWVASGRARPQLLDSYARERIPVAERLLKTTDRAFSVVVSDRVLAGLIRTRVVPRLLAFAMRFEKTRKLAFRTVSQIGIRYPASPLSRNLPGLPRGAPTAGDRFPPLELKFDAAGEPEELFARLDDTRISLLLIGEQPVPDGWRTRDELVDIHRIPDEPVNRAGLARLGIVGPACFLLRPDGHIGLAGARVGGSDLRSYLEDALSLMGPDARQSGN